MSDTPKIFHANLRLYLDRAADREVWEIIQQNKEQFRSTNEFLAYVICQYGKGTGSSSLSVKGTEELTDIIAEKVVARLNASLNAGTEADQRSEQTNHSVQNEEVSAERGNDKNNFGDLVPGGNTEETEDEFELDSAAMDFLDSLS